MFDESIDYFINRFLGSRINPKGDNNPLLIIVQQLIFDSGIPLM